MPVIFMTKIIVPFDGMPETGVSVIIFGNNFFAFHLLRPLNLFTLHLANLL